MRALLLSLSMFALSHPATADTMRCGHSLVDERSSLAELLEKCGEPQDKATTTEDVFAVNPAGLHYRTGAKTTRERWYYQRSPRSLRMVVTIIDGVVKDIERAGD